MVAAVIAQSCVVYDPEMLPEWPSDGVNAYPSCSAWDRQEDAGCSDE